MAIIRTHKKTIAASVLLLAAVCAWTLTAGNLNPAGPPTSGTMKTLGEVEPRIPINATKTPGGSGYTYRITQPGSYYLTGHVTVTANLGGICIEADDVTIDLMGYCIENTYSGAKSYHGIFCDSSRKNVTVKNGTLKGFVIGAASHNVNSSCIQFIGLRAVGNTTIGLYIYGSSSATNSGGGSVIRDCVAENNGNDGIYGPYASLIENCVAKSNGYTGISNGAYGIIRNCASYYNGRTGIYADAGSVVENNICAQNGEWGIYAISCSVKANTVSYSGMQGIYAWSGTIIGNTVRFNQQDGIYAYNSFVDQNACIYNNQSGGSYHNLSVSSCTLGLNHAP